MRAGHVAVSGHRGDVLRRLVHGLHGLSRQRPETFAVASSHLNIWLGGINTVVLLTSSFTMALAVYAAHHRNRQESAAWFLARHDRAGARVYGHQGVRVLRQVSATGLVPIRGLSSRPETLVEHNDEWNGRGIRQPAVRAQRPRVRPRQGASLLRPVFRDDRRALPAHGDRHRDLAIVPAAGGAGDLPAATSCRSS